MPNQSLIHTQFFTSPEMGAGPSLSEAYKQAAESSFCDFKLLEPQCAGIKERASFIKKNFDQTVYVGIGGSYWTPNSLHTYFSDVEKHELFFLDGPETKSFISLFRRIKDVRRTHFVFISKSGSTLEPLSLLSSLVQYGKNTGFDLHEQTTLVCSPGANPMRNWADRKQVHVLEFPTEIGGRFSALTAVGLLAAELLGLDCVQFLNGAKSAKENQDLVVKLASYGLKTMEAGLPITQMWAYSASLWPVGQWWQQLWSESLAKKGGPAVSTPMVCCGPRDQHSLLQQLMEGARDKSVFVLQDESLKHHNVPLGKVFIDYEDLKDSPVSLSDVLVSEIEGFCGSVIQNGIPLCRISADFSKAQTWGEFFMLWQMVVATMGFHLKVNPFDQPGVEKGKVLARQYLKSMNAKES